MAEPEEPRRIPTGPPGAPLPRLWKVQPDPPEEEAETPKGKKKKKKGGDAAAGSSGKPAKGSSKKEKSAAGSPDGAAKGKLLEETPTLDTYEARQAARIITGAVIFGVLLVIGFFVVRAFRSESPDTEPAVDEGRVAQNRGADADQTEREARSMLQHAREAAGRGNADLAVSLLTKIKDTYPRTKSAQEAREALGRPAKKLPLFLDRPAVVASSTEPAVPDHSPTAPTQVVDATRAETPGATAAQAKLVLPANTPEPPAVAVRTEMPAKVETPSKPLPAGFQKRTGTQIHASGWPIEIVGDRDGAPMVLVPAGTYVIGHDGGDASESPSHKVTLAAYYIDQHEVTVRQFDLFQKEAGKRTERARALAKSDGHGGESEDSPVVMVSARDAKDYADWAGKKLPTEAQWEAAARGPDGRVYPGGPEPPQWERARKPRHIDPIRSFPNDVSPFAVFDMAANAWEWTKDWYDPHYFQHSPGDNPTGPSQRPRSQQLVVKGGSKNGAFTKRDALKWDTRLPYVGFRCVLPVENAPSAGTPTAPNQPAPSDGSIPF